MKDSVLLGRAADAAAAGSRGPAVRVCGLEELAHEAEASVADVGAAGKHVKDGVDAAAEESKGRDVGACCFGSLDHCGLALQIASHLEVNGQGC